MNDTAFCVELTGPGLSLKRELNEPRAHQLLLWLLSGAHEPLAQTGVQRLAEQPASPPAPSPLAHGHRTDVHAVAIREFMEQHKPVRIPDKIACIALFLREHRQKKEFGRAELVQLFQEAAETLPKNLGRDIRWTQQCGWIAPVVGSADLFYMTKKGEDAVKQCFPKELVAKTKIVFSPRRRRSFTEAGQKVSGVQTENQEG